MTAVGAKRGHGHKLLTPDKKGGHQATDSECED